MLIFWWEISFHSGSCWAFSATGAIEGANAIATGTLVSVSEQELVTCDVGGMSSGCNGGLMDDAFEWVVNNGGIATEEAYPYESSSGESGVCNTKLVSCSYLQEVCILLLIAIIGGGSLCDLFSDHTLLIR